MVPLKIGLVGLGGIGRRHLQTLSRLDGVRVTAVADVDGQRARSHAEQCDATGYADWQDLLARETIDALFVCTPPAAHAQPALAAFERGVHVFVEKPLARRQEDADAIASAARRSGLVCGVGYQWRAIDFLDDVREALADQEISFVIGRSLGSTRPRPWFVDLKEGGGILLELATHDIDLQRAIAGEVVAVQAAASKVPLAQSPVDDRRVENAMSLCLRFATGALGVINVAWTADGTPEVYSLDIAASEATLRIDLGGHATDRSRPDPPERSLARASGECGRDPASIAAQYREVYRGGTPRRPERRLLRARRCRAGAEGGTCLRTGARQRGDGAVGGASRADVSARFGQVVALTPDLGM